jgi:myo-inositol-1(or 4)-monophosphatase
MENFADAILPIIRSTRSISLPHWGIAEVASQKSESATDVVTRLDLEIEEYLAKEFSKVDEGIAFVGEEYGGDRTAARHWLVDPIDGTAHFVRGLPFCTTMVALIENGKVTFSAIYDFLNDTMYHAQRGKGAYKENERINVSNRDLASSYLCYESNLTKGNNMETYLKLRKRASLLNTVSAGYEFILVATGKVEGRICLEPYGKDYDFAPGCLLVAEAGGIVSNIGTTEYDFSNVSFIASNKSVHESLIQGSEAIFPISTSV